MDIKILFFGLLFGLFSGQKKSDINIVVFQEKANDSICIIINNTSSDTIKLLLDTHGLGRRLSLKSPKITKPLGYIFAALYYEISSKYHIEKGEKYLNGLNYGLYGDQSLEQYIIDNTHILPPKSFYHFKIDFNEVSFCKNIDNRKKRIDYSFKVSYFGTEIIKYLKKESVKISQDLSKIDSQKYFNENITSNTIKLKGNICY